MAFASSPTDSPLDDEERALLDSFYQGIAPRQEHEHHRAEGPQEAPESPNDGAKVISHPGAAAPVQTVGEPAKGESAADAGDDPFAALKKVAGNRSTIDLPGPRAGYRVEETSNGNFTVEHLASREEVRVSGVDYLRFSDLQLHSEFLTRTNPPMTPQATAEPASEPTEDPGPPSEATPAEDSFTSPDIGSNKEPAAVAGQTESPEADYDSAFTAAEDGSITFSADDLLGGASGPSGGGMRVVAVTGGGNGILADNGDNSWTFTPDRDFDGSVELEVTIADGRGGIETAMATIEITPARDNPAAGPQNPTASEGSGLAAGSVVASAADGGAMTYSLVSGPAEGAVTVHADGSYSFDPGNDFEDLSIGEVRDVSFIYHASDGQGASDSGIVTITVTGSDDGPVASERSLVAPESSTIATPHADLETVQSDNGGGATDCGDDRIAGDFDNQSADSLDGGAAKDDIQDSIADRVVDDGPADRTIAEASDGDLPDNIPSRSSSGTEAVDNPPQIDASNKDLSSEARPGMLIGSGDIPSLEERIAAPPREQTLRTDPMSPSQASDSQEITQPAGPTHPERQVPALDGGPEEVSIRADQGHGALKGENGDDRVDIRKPDDTIDLSTARNWTVTYANGDNFTANDALDASLFTDTAGTIDFGNGDEVKFENVKQFTW